MAQDKTHNAVHGSKDLLPHITQTVSGVSTRQNFLNSVNDWNGYFTVQVAVELSKIIHDYEAGKSIYDALTIDTAAHIHHISSFQVKKQDSISQKETFRTLRVATPWIH